MLSAKAEPVSQIVVHFVELVFRQLPDRLVLVHEVDDVAVASGQVASVEASVYCLFQFHLRAPSVKPIVKQIYHRLPHLSNIFNGFLLTFFCYCCKIGLTQMEGAFAMTLGEYINNYLIEHDMSIREFARLADISHTYVSYIVNGKTGRGTKPVLTIDKYKKIARAMNMDVNDLLAAVDVDIAIKEPADNMSERENMRAEMRILFDAAEDAPASALLEAAALIMRYKEQSQ